MPTAKLSDFFLDLSLAFFSLIESEISEQASLITSDNSSFLPHARRSFMLGGHSYNEISVWTSLTLTHSILIC